MSHSAVPIISRHAEKHAVNFLQHERQASSKARIPVQAARQQFSIIHCSSVAAAPPSMPGAPRLGVLAWRC